MMVHSYDNNNSSSINLNDINFTLNDDDDDVDNDEKINIFSDGILISNNTTTNGLYHQSITLTARMWPPVEAGSPSTIWGLPVLIWGIIIGCLIIAIIIPITYFFCYWLSPKRNKFLSPVRFCSTNSANKQESIMSYYKTSVSKQWRDSSSSGHVVMPISAGLAPPQYNPPPPPGPKTYHNNISNNNNSNQYITEYSSSPVCERISASPIDSKRIIPDTHKSMWAINPLSTSNSVLNEQDVNFKSRSLPSWGKTKQRPISTTDDLEELYAKVNFSKKRRNRMRNDEAAIIALCRSRSQHLAGLPLEREGVVIYDERTAL